MANQSQSIPLHFVHHTSPRNDAIPLIFVHGWPGSFLEVEYIIDLLTNPPNASLPAFQVVAPSIPGYGFSPAPDFDGFGPREAGHAFNALMQQLNYSKYVYQGGDLGGLMLPYMAYEFPENFVSGLANIWPVAPNAVDLTRYAGNRSTADEIAYIQNIEAYITQRSGYRQVMQTRPLLVSYALTDSPLGFTMWYVDLLCESNHVDLIMCITTGSAVQ